MSRFNTGHNMRLLSSFLALALSTSAALAADVGPLSPGAPAGVKHAQDYDSNTTLYILLGAAAVAGIAVAASSGGGSSAPAAAPPVVATTTSTV
jgi:hypothetical protein